MEIRHARYLDLFWTFCRIGGLTFGGGYAMLPMLQKEVVETKKWATEEEVMDYYAVGQCTPGVIAVNTATFIGYKHHGVLGAIVATAGVVFPSLVIIMILAAFLQSFAEFEIVQHAFNGIRVTVCVLVLNAVIKLWKGSVIDKDLFKYCDNHDFNRSFRFFRSYHQHFSGIYCDFSCYCRISC